MIPDLPIGDLGDIQAPPRWRNTALVALALAVAVLVGAGFTLRFQRTVTARGAFTMRGDSALEFTVPASDAKLLRSGQVAWVTFEGLDRPRTVRGTVAEVDPAARGAARVTIALPLHETAASGGVVAATVAIVTEPETLARRVRDALGVP